MFKSIILLGATTLVAAVEKISIPLPEPIIIETPQTLTDIPSGFQASIDLAVLKQAGNEWFDTII